MRAQKFAKTIGELSNLNATKMSFDAIQKSERQREKKSKKKKRKKKKEKKRT